MLLPTALNKFVLHYQYKLPNLSAAFVAYTTRYSLTILASAHSLESK